MAPTRRNGKPFDHSIIAPGVYRELRRAIQAVVENQWKVNPEQTHQEWRDVAMEIIDSMDLSDSCRECRPDILGYKPQWPFRLDEDGTAWYRCEKGHTFSCSWFPGRMT